MAVPDLTVSYKSELTFLDTLGFYVYVQISVNI